MNEMPKFGYPRFVLFNGNFSSDFTLEDGRRPMIEVCTLENWVNALFVTENGHCFKIERMNKGRIITPWYLRGWFSPSCVEFSCKTKYCPSLSFENVYPLLWRALDIATTSSVFLERKNVLGAFSSRDRVSRYGSGGCISKRMKKNLKTLLEQRVPLRIFFESYIEMVKAHSFNSPYL